jgi:hypothetical protein
MPKSGHLFCQPHTHRGGGNGPAVAIVACICVAVYAADVIVTQYLWLLVSIGAVLIGVVCGLAFAARKLSSRVNPMVVYSITDAKDRQLYVGYDDDGNRLERLESTVLSQQRLLEQMATVNAAALEAWSGRQLERLRDSEDDIPNT